MGQGERQVVRLASLFNAYTFQFYYLQVIQTLADGYGEHNAYSTPGLAARLSYPFKKYMGAGFSLGLLTTIVLFAIYTFIISLLWYSLYKQE